MCCRKQLESALCDHFGGISGQSGYCSRVLKFLGFISALLMVAAGIITILAIQIPRLSQSVAIVKFEVFGGEKNSLEFPMVSICANGDLTSSTVASPSILDCRGPNTTCTNQTTLFRGANPNNASQTIECVVINNASAYPSIKASTRASRLILTLNLAPSLGLQNPFIPADGVFLVFSPQNCNPLTCSLRAIVAPNTFNSFGLEKEIEYRSLSNHSSRTIIFLFSHSDAPLVLQNSSYDPAVTTIIELYFRTLVVTNIEQESLTTKSEIISEVGGMFGYLSMVALIVYLGLKFFQWLFGHCCNCNPSNKTKIRFHQLRDDKNLVPP